jgi:hypothetical protein
MERLVSLLARMLLLAEARAQLVRVLVCVRSIRFNVCSEACQVLLSTAVKQ